VLDELLGLGNDLMNSFCDWIDERVDPLLPNELEARTMALMTEVAHKDMFEELEEMEIDLALNVAERMQINSELRKSRGLSTEEIYELTVYKDDIREKELTRKDKDKLKAKETIAYQAKIATKKHDVSIRVRQGCKEKATFNEIESDILIPKFNAGVLSSYHGNDFEGPQIKRLMRYGAAVCKCIQGYFSEKRDEMPELPPENKVIQLCGAHREMLELLAGRRVFLDEYQKRRCDW
jgi:hypothetical protein